MDDKCYVCEGSPKRPLDHIRRMSDPSEDAATRILVKQKELDEVDEAVWRRDAEFLRQKKMEGLAFDDGMFERYASWDAEKMETVNLTWTSDFASEPVFS